MFITHRVTQLLFERDRTISASQARTTNAKVIAVELIDAAGNVALGFAQSLFTPLPDSAEIERLFALKAWPTLEGGTPHQSRWR